MDSTIAHSGPRRVAATVAIVLLLVGLGSASFSGLGNATISGSFGQSPAAHADHSVAGPAAPSIGSSHQSTFASRPFPAVPGIVLTPTSGPVGTAVTATGSNFIASSNSSANAVTVTWAPGGWVLCNVETDSSGNFTCGFVVPAGVAGAHAIKATDTVPDTATATFTVGPQIVITPASGIVGASASVAATGFAGASSTTIVWAPTATQICKLDTSAVGNLTCAFTVPGASSVGVHLVTATDSSANAASANFTVTPTPPAPPTVSVVVTSVLHLYMATPLMLNWTITSSAPVNTGTTNMWLLVQDLGSTACPFIGGGNVVQNPPCTVVDLSLNHLLVNGTSSYTFTVTDANLTIQNYNGGILPFSTEYAVAIFVNMSTSPYVNGTTSGSVGQGGATQDVYLQTYLPSGTLVSPNPNAGVSTGNVSIVVSYAGDFVSGAELSISSATGQLVYSAGVAVAGLGPHVGTAAATWRPTDPGKYTATLNLSGPFGFTLTTYSLVVVPAGTTVYVNTTTYHNQSLLKGLSEGTTATLLLLIGLIIGMVVALLLGRMVWGGESAAAKPPAPWSSKPADKDGKTDLKPNECPICHQQFASAEELAEHQTKAHGASP
jgi:hypothetical protein